MLLSKLTDSDQIRSDKSALVTENENLKAERRELLQRLSEFEKSQEAMSQELLTQKEDIKAYLHNVSKLKEENDKKTREVTLLKETTTKQKLELDHDLSRLENDNKRYEDQVPDCLLHSSSPSSSSDVSPGPATATGAVREISSREPNAIRSPRS
jgi:uncharacterized protein YhaN